MLKFQSVSDLRQWAAAARANEPLMLQTDVLMHLSVMLGIFSNLRQFLASADQERRWLFGPNRAPPFLGRSPMDLLVGGTFESQFGVRRYVEGIVFGLPHPPNEADHDFRPYTDDNFEWK
jgi:hypothetical protein